MSLTINNPCLSCGACCSFFRVSFYWAEAQCGGGTVPDQLTEQINLHKSCMLGTNQIPSRCFALLGDVGSEVRCTIYQNRSSTCMKFNTHLEDGSVNPECSKARAHFGMLPLVEFLPREQVT